MMPVQSATKLLLVAALLPMAAAASACWVPTPGVDVVGPAATYDAATAVFLGRVIDRALVRIRCDAASLDMCDGELVHVVVLKTWKGSKHPGDTATFANALDVKREGCYDLNVTNHPAWLRTGSRSSGDSGQPISRTWLFYVNGKEPWRISSLSRSMPVMARNRGREEMSVLDRIASSRRTTLPTD